MDGYCSGVKAPEQKEVLMQINLNSSQLLVPQWQVPHLVGLLAQIQAIEGYSTTAKAVPVTFNMSIVDSFVTQPISEREKEIQKDLDQKNNYWLQEREESRKLREQLKKVTARLDEREKQDAQGH